ncbi:MAG TPA: glycoside hydrolase family 32 protein [Bryobacteraceae bacterium]|nr:glycoside hydrolase family 32 protein [Bryobacteraceae bacterium]
MRRRDFLALAGAAPFAAAVPASKLAADPHRPQYHLLPTANWMNDPNGPIYWQGKYHMFYQYNPNGAFWGDMHWGHAVSDDMVRWKHLPMAMAPTPGGPDKDGVFSGCAVIDNDTVAAIYTGVNPETQCIATSSGDLTSWKKFAGNPVVAAPPSGLEVAGFRDPAVWKEGDTWLMAVGSGFRGKGGGVLLYESRDLRRWSYLHPLVTGRMKAGASAKDPVDSGEMWECPDFFSIDQKYLLIYSTERVVKYQLGIYTDRVLHPETMGGIDHGCYYAARTMTNTGDRRILWGWVTEGRSEAAQRAAGWSGVMSLPRELKLYGAQVQMRPAAEVETLRGKHLGADAGGDCLEIRAEIDPGNAVQAGLKLRAAPDSSEQTLVYYDRQARLICVDRSQSSTDASADHTMQSGPFLLGRGEPLRLHIFLDGSVVEIFVNDRFCLTARIYPAGTRSTGLGLYATAITAKMLSFDVWEMRPISPNRLTS